MLVNKVAWDNQPVVFNNHSILKDSMEQTDSRLHPLLVDPQVSQPNNKTRGILRAVVTAALIMVNVPLKMVIGSNGINSHIFLHRA